MFTWFGKKDWQNSSPHLLLLSKFRHGDAPKGYEHAEYWESALKEKPQKAIQRFLKEEMLEPAELTELLNFKFKVSELKRMLKKRQLKVSGCKSELIKRLIGSDEEEMTEITKDLEILKCSIEGERLADYYLKEEKRKREKAEKEVIRLLRHREFLKAIRIVTKFESSQVFPRGLGVDWNNYSGESDVDVLQVIFGKIPGILNGIDEGCLESLRLAAAMMQLWGTNRVRPWLPNDLKTGIHLDGDVAARMFVFHALHLRNIKQYKNAGIKTIEILGINDANACSACRKISGKKYNINKVPELPNPNCTSEIGCRCTTVASDF